MKTRIFFLLAFSCWQILASAQTFAIIEPQNQRFGVVHAFMDDRFTSKLNNLNISPYLKAWTGTVNGQGFHAWTIKESIGARISLRKDEEGFFAIGINYAHYFAAIEEFDSRLNNLKRLSFELGLCAKLGDKIWLLMITDPLNWESCIGIGWDFARRQKIYDRNYKIK